MLRFSALVVGVFQDQPVVAQKGRNLFGVQRLPELQHQACVIAHHHMTCIVSQFAREVGHGEVPPITLDVRRCAQELASKPLAGAGDSGERQLAKHVAPLSTPSARAHDRLTRDPLVRQRPWYAASWHIRTGESQKQYLKNLPRDKPRPVILSPPPLESGLGSVQCANNAKRPAVGCPYTDPGTWRGTSSVLDESAAREAEFCPDRSGIPAANWSLRQGHRRRQRRPHLDPEHDAFPYVRCSWNKERNTHSAGYPSVTKRPSRAPAHSGTGSASC